MRDLLDAVARSLGRGERIAWVTAVRSVGSTPRHTAARLAVLPHGEAIGSIGGGTMELQAVADARAALHENKPRLAQYNLVGRGEGNLGLCGGTQEFFIEVLDPSARMTAEWQALRTTLDLGEPVVRALVVRSEGAAPVPGTHMLVRRGDTVGMPGPAWSGIVDQARRVMAERYSQRVSFDAETGATRRLMSTHRAASEVLLDLYEPQPGLLIIGAGHIGAALARQAAFLGWHVTVVDDRPEFLAAGSLPEADVTRLVPYDPATERLGPLGVPVTAGTAVVVATWGWDEPALRQLAGAPAFYVGLVASLRKAAVILQALREEGVDPGWLESVRVPVGLDIGAESPEEIALAIMAEILAAARGKSGRPLREVRGERAAALVAHPVKTHVQ